MYKPTLFFFNDTAHPEIYTLSLHDALPILTTFTLFPRRTPTRSPPAQHSRGRACAPWAAARTFGVGAVIVLARLTSRRRACRTAGARIGPSLTRNSLLTMTKSKR